MTTSPHWDVIDGDTKTLLDGLDTDDYPAFLTVLARVAGANNGVIDQNLLRPHLTFLEPKLRGNFIGKAAHDGVIVQHGFNTNTDVKSRNRGKPQRVYLLAGAA